MPELKKTIATRKKWLIFSHILPHTAHVQSSVPQKGRADRISVKTKNLSLKYSQKGVENRISNYKLSTNDKPQVPQQSLLEGGDLLCWSRHGRSKNWCGGVVVCLFCPPIKCFLIKTTLRKSQHVSSERGLKNTGVSKRRGLASPHRRTALENIPGFYRVQKVDVATIMTIMMSKYWLELENLS